MTEDAAPRTAPSSSTSPSSSTPPIRPPTTTSSYALTPAVSAAELPPDEPADEPRRAREWYGLPLVVLDGLALATIGVGRGIGDDAVLITGAVGGIVNGLVIHTFAYDEKHRFTGLGKGLLSVALRGGLAGLGCSAGSGCGELEDAALLRLSLGIAVGAAIDDALLAYKPRKTSGQAARFTVFPLLSRGSAGAAMAGSF